MPRLSQWAVRLALVYLVLGFSFGSLMLANKGILFHPALWALLPAHIEVLMLGWMIQLVLGVAFWILPRFSRAPRRGNERLAWLALALLNLGIWLVALGPFASATALAGGLSLAGRAAEAGAALAFAAHAWPRVKAAGA